LLYGAFVFAQTVRHQEDFVEDLISADAVEEALSNRRETVVSAVLLFVGLAGIVLLAEQIAGSIEDELRALNVSQSDAVVGAFIATLVLMPEAAAAVRAALRNELQRGLNIALGSACATIGLTIPAVAIASLATDKELILGLNAGDTLLLVLALAISIVSFGTGRTTVLTGLVHLVVFVAYLLLIVAP
jgi:Ca2+:H+ antiporter